MQLLPKTQAFAEVTLLPKIVPSPVPNLLLRLTTISDSGSLIMQTFLPELFIFLFLFVRNVSDFLDLSIPQIKCHTFP